MPGAAELDSDHLIGICADIIGYKNSKQDRNPCASQTKTLAKKTLLCQAYFIFLLVMQKYWGKQNVILESHQPVSEQHDDNERQYEGDEQNTMA